MNERQVIRGFIANIEVVPTLVVTFQFNPKSISDNKTVTYGEGNTELCGNSPGKVYTGGGDRTLSFDLQLHGLEQGTNELNPSPVDNGISTELAKLRSFLYPKEDAWATFGLTEEGKRVSSPPNCIFGFGTKILECIVTKIDITESQFNSTLAPVKADVNITLVVNEKPGNALYEIDKQHRNTLATLGIQNISFY